MSGTGPREATTLLGAPRGATALFGAPRGATTLFGHDDALASFTRAWHAGRLHHAWLISGPGGVGKATLAYRIARTVLAGGEPEAASRRIAAGTHPDLLVVERTASSARSTEDRPKRLRQEIVIEDVAAVASFLHRTAAMGGWRVVIVDGLDLANRNAANALLRLIEEPPERTVFLLIASAAGRVLPTLRSRCRTLRLASLDPATMRRALAVLLPGLADDERQDLVGLARGAPGRAVLLAAEDGLALSRLARDVLDASPRPAGIWAYELADSILRRENGFSTFIDLLSERISATARADERRRVRTEEPAASGAVPIDGPTGTPNPWVTNPWVEVCSQLAGLRTETEALNLDKRQSLLTGLDLLSRVGLLSRP
ncbi:DNA polymerase III subunit delta' [Lichenicoccus sp.]|uniref:DNA polymerase III subunit delta' n=1 Tax=Lichenicoccus sp. TaxID=2781899 RepID=UPI003D0C96A9